MPKFFQSEIAAHAGGKQTFQNVKFKKNDFNSSAGAEAGTLLEIIPVHIKRPPVIQFIAYIDSMSDRIQSTHTAEQPFGRTDPFYIWSKSKRSIQISWALPASSKAMALDNLNNLSWLMASLYPSYKEADTATSIAASPLFRVRHANLISSPTSDGQGILCVIQGLNVRHDTSMGFISIKPFQDDFGLIKSAGFENSTNAGKNILVPKLMKLSCNLDIVHDHSLGWDFSTGQWRGGLGATGYPYDFGLVRDTSDMPAAGPVYEDAQTPATSARIPGSTQDKQDELQLRDLNDKRGVEIPVES
tara:strand:- start:97 stop:1002 length:906 start_codon:yes stop_codon:yes gene_type:complete